MFVAISVRKIIRIYRIIFKRTRKRATDANRSPSYRCVGKHLSMQTSSVCASHRRIFVYYHVLSRKLILFINLHILSNSNRTRFVSVVRRSCRFDPICFTSAGRTNTLQSTHLQCLQPICSRYSVLHSESFINHFHISSWCDCDCV